MNDPKDPSAKKTIKKRIVKKIIKKKKSDTSDAEGIQTVKQPDDKPRRRIIKRKAATRRFSQEALDEVLGRKTSSDEIPAEKKVEEVSPVKFEVKVEERVEEKVDDTGESPRKVRRRRVVKKRPAIKRVVKKKAVTRRLARETVEQVLGKKLGSETRDEGQRPQQSEERAIPSPKKPEKLTKDDLTGHKKSSESRETIEVPAPKLSAPEVLIPKDWKEKKIASYKSKPQGEPSFPALPKGTLLNDRYKVSDTIHKDPYGVVYKAEDLKVEKKYAVKAIKEIQYFYADGFDKDAVDEAVNGLKRMSSFLQDLSHTNLARVTDYFFDIGDDGVRFFIVEEFIEGKSLEEILKNHTKEKIFMEAKSIFKYMKQISEGLHCLHNKKPFPIAYGELKPSNIMINNSGEVKCINYGIARVGDSDPDEYIGTIGYSAPERKGVDFTNIKADIFALGATFYYLLTGIDPEKEPYEFKAIKDTKPFISDKVEAFVFKCLEEHPGARPEIGEVKKLIAGLDFFELDTSTEEAKKVEEKKQAIEATKTSVVAPKEETDTDMAEEEETSFYKTLLFKIGLPVLVAFIIIIIIIIVKFW